MQISLQLFYRRLISGMSRMALAGLFLFGGGLAGCGGADVTGLESPEQALLTVVMNTRAVTLATAAGYDTVRLSAVAYRGTGESIPDAAVTYSVSDPALYVTPEGLVTAIKETTNSYAVGRSTYQGITRTDTTWIRVINTAIPSPLQTFSISVPDTLDAGTTIVIGLTARDTSNKNQALQMPVEYRVSDTRFATVSHAGELKTILPERTVTVYAATRFLGVTYTDSAVVSIGYPITVQMYVRQRQTATGETVLEFSPNVAYLAAGGTVLFCNCSYQFTPNIVPIDVVFDNPDDVDPSPIPLYPTGAGNIPPFMRTSENPLSLIQTRVFPKSGTYTFHSERFGSSGRIIVR